MTGNGVPALRDLVHRFGEFGDRAAVIGPATACLFGELVDSIGHWCHILSREGVEPGSVVSLEGDFSPTAIALLLALAERGAVVLPQRRDDCGDRERQDDVAQVELRIQVDPADDVVFERTGRTASHPLYDELRNRDRPGLIQFTSGTSGAPKAAVHDLSLLLEKFRVRRPPLSTIAFLLFDHMGGLNTMLHTLSNGATLVCPPDRSPETVCQLIERHDVELLAATPTFLNLLLLSGAQAKHDLGSLRAISYGAEAMPASTLTRLREAFSTVRLQQTYGMVELGVLRTKSRDDGSLWVKVGGEGVQTRVVDGRLQVRMPSLLLGYLDAPTPITADGWFETGDMVERDGAYLRFLGKDSDLINIGGLKVYPVEIESVIESLPGVAEAAVYGESNRLVGQVVCASVVPAGEVDDAKLAAQVKRFCRARLPTYKVPVRVRVVASLAPESRHKKQRRRS